MDYPQTGKLVTSRSTIPETLNGFSKERQPYIDLKKEGQKQRHNLTPFSLSHCQLPAILRQMTRYIKDGALKRTLQLTKTVTYTNVSLQHPSRIFSWNNVNQKIEHIVATKNFIILT